MRTKLLLVLLSVLSMGSARAQIAITQHDLSVTVTALATGVQWNSDDTTGLRALLVKNGPDQTWDFSHFTYILSASESQATLLDPQDAPLHSDAHFAEATLVAMTAESDTVHNYFYIKFTQDGWWGLGYVTDRNGAVSLSAYYEPPSFNFKLPLTYLSTWLNNYTIYELEYNDSFQNRETEAVDSYGTLILPGGRSMQALRIVRTSGDGYRTFEWLTQEGVWLTARMGSDGGIYSGPSYTEAAPNGAVRPADAATRGVTVFPNPSAQFVNVEVPFAQTCRMQIMDDIGRSVNGVSTQLVDSDHIQVDVSTLHPGAYHVKIVGAAGTTVSPFVVSGH